MKLTIRIRSGCKLFIKKNKQLNHKCARWRMMIQNESVAFRSDLMFVNIKPYKSHISFKTLPHIIIYTFT